MNSDLAAASTDVAWRFSAYGSYEGLESRAIAALRRRVPGHSREDYERALSAALALVAACRAVLAVHATPYLHIKGDYDFTPLHDHLGPHLDEFGRNCVDSLLGMVLFYDHLK